uniref:ABC transporter permease n=1 Tax=Thermogemmatispora argillosa TaxID=2045280 RepID=A0A455T698_9CHLR|nr:ABC transporter permease [Thermogemmatispora argillosa]
MHLRGMLAIARKDIIDIVQNKAMLVGLLIPIIMAVLFSFLNSLISGTPTRLLIYNPGHSPVERIVSAAFSSPAISYAASPAEVEAAFGPDGTHKQSPYALGLIVPATFESDLRAGRHPQVQLFLNGESVGATQRALLTQALTDYGRQVVNPEPPLTVVTSTINPPQPSAFGQDSRAFFVMYVLVMTIMNSANIVPGLIIEEKEKKTLRMLLASPVSFGDIIAAKLLVSLAYQILLLAVVFLIMQGFTGDLPWLLLFLFIGACLSNTLGLLIGCLFQTTSASGAMGGILTFFFSVPSLFVGPLGQLAEGQSFMIIVKAVPFYYLAEGIYQALSSQISISTLTTDLAVTAGTTLLFFLLAAWSLRHQAAVASSI